MTVSTINLKTQMFYLRMIVIVAIGILILISTGCAIQREDYAGSVNGVNIKKQNFMESHRGHFTGFVLENDRTPDELEKRELFRQTWRDITIHVILKEYFKKYQIQVTQQEVIDSLLNNIPHSITTAPVYQTNGTFDKALYVNTLVSDKSRQLDWLKRHYYDYYVPLAKLKLELQDRSIIKLAEIKRLQKVLNTTADIDWIVFEPERAEVVVTQSEIENYYSGHLNEYRTKPYASFGWVAIQVKPNQEDADIAKARIDSIYFEITNGKLFVSMVERFSQSSSALAGGSLGFVKFEDLPEIVRRSLEGLEKNSFTRPIKLDDTYVIYQLVERTRNLVKLNELVIDVVPGEKNKSSKNETAIQLRDLGMQLGLETAAHEMSFRYRLSGVIDKDSLWLADGSIGAYLIDRAYTQKAGTILEPVYSKVMQAWITAQIIEVQPRKFVPLLTVSDEIALKLRTEKQRTRTLEIARNWVQLNKTGYLAAGEKAGFSIVRISDTSINSTFQSEPLRSIFVEVITNYEKKNLPVPYRLGSRIVVPVVSQTRTINPPVFSTIDVRKYYFEYLNPDWFDKWLDAEVKKADVKIWFSNL